MNSFKTPRHQSFNGVFIIFLADLLKRIKQNIYLLALPFISESVREYILFFYLGIILLVVLQFIYTYILFKKYTFYLSDDGFHLQKGLFNRREIEIPFDRIQNINLQQNFLQQILSVVGLDIETAGESKAEVQIKALRKEDAEELKSLLLRRKYEKLSEDDLDDQVNFQDETNDKLNDNLQYDERVIFQLGFLELLKVGLSSNILKGLSLVFAFIAYAFNTFSDFYKQSYDEFLTEQITTTNQYFTGQFLLIFLAGFALIAIGFLVTAIFTIIKYFNLRVIQLDKDYEVEYGLFNRFKKVLKPSKAQTLEVLENPIRKLFGFKNVFVSQASAEETTEKNKIGLVGLSADYLKLFFKILFNGKILKEQSFIRLRCHFFRLRVDLSRLLFAIIALLLLLIWNQSSIYSFVALLLLSALLAVFSYLRVKKSYVSFSDQMLKIGSGIIGTKTTFLEIYKVQSIKVSQSFFQKRRNLSSLTIYTASGSLKVKYLDAEHVQKLTNYLMFKIESSKKEWI